MARYTGPNNGTKCPCSSWRGDPNHSLAKNGACKMMMGHLGDCIDLNGNRFRGHLWSAQVIINGAPFGPEPVPPNQPVQIDAEVS